jgi:tRNA(fMet)-specific endonuclease VapC
LRLALDTNRYADLCLGVEKVVEAVGIADSVYLPFVVIAELRAGFALGSRERENERELRRFLAKPGVEPLYPVDATTRVWARLMKQLRQQGTPIPASDLWIASLVVEHELTLYTRDAHFAHLPQLELLA